MISILLASYNGEKYIKEQIESLLEQTVQDFRLFICDDKSTDSTYSIAQDYVIKYPGKIFAEQNDENLGAAKRNFIKMMAKYKDDYVMLCDQDDVWLPDKIEKSLAKIKEMEEQYGQEKPLLVHTDLTVTDEDLKITARSYMEKVNARYEKSKLNNIIVSNTLAGCVTIFNMALADLISDNEPEFMIMHDWWIAFIASAFGEIGTVYDQTILYRQHACNEYGINKRNPVSHLFHKLFNFSEVRETLSNTYRQADSFLILYKDVLTLENSELIAAYASIPQKKKLKRLRTLLKYKTWKNGFMRRLAQCIAV